jgi:hypothetical protein
MSLSFAMCRPYLFFTFYLIVYEPLMKLYVDHLYMTKISASLRSI